MSAKKSLQKWLETAVDPPSELKVATAVSHLKEMGALGEDEQLTRIGYCLQSLSISSKYGKAILYGCYFSCLDPILTIAAIMTER